MKIGIIGTGYVGLVSGACFAESGHQVICVDKDSQKIDKLRQSEIPIYEPGLDELVDRNQREHRLNFSCQIRDICDARPEVIFFTVGTPPKADGSADLSFLFQAAEEVAKYLVAPALLVSKSTVPVGTCRKLWNLLQQKTEIPFEIISNPEFLKEGDAIHDFTKPDRIVVGCQSEQAKQAMTHLYEPFVRTDNPILFVDLESAEMIKYASNAFLAAKISFMNELSQICQATCADIDAVRKGMGFDKRIGHSFMFAGVGYGGSCFPKDVKALAHLAEEKGMSHQLMSAIDEVNERQKNYLAERLAFKFGSDLKGKTIALWGLSFKPKTDDIREAPALTMINRLLKMGATVRATDPVAIENMRQIYPEQVAFSHDQYAVIEGADALVLLTEWAQYRRPDFLKMKAIMRRAVIFDGRNIYQSQAMKALGFEYEGIGKS